MFDLKHMILASQVKSLVLLSLVYPNSQSSSSLVKSYICQQAWNWLSDKRYSVSYCKNVQFFKNSSSPSSSLPHIPVLTSHLSDPKNSALQTVAYWKQLMPFMQHPVPPSVLFLMHMQLVFNKNNKFLN